MPDYSSKAVKSVQKVLETLCEVVGLHIAELWINDSEKFCLSATYIDESAINLSPYLGDVMTFQHGDKESTTSRNLCKRALQSKHSFHWLSRKNEQVHPIIPYHTAISFHLPQDNINSDCFICAYSLEYIPFSQSKLDFLYWLSHAACVAAFSVSLYHKGHRDSFDDRLAIEVDGHGNINNGSSGVSEKESGVDASGNRPGSMVRGDTNTLISLLSQPALTRSRDNSLLVPPTASAFSPSPNLSQKERIDSAVVPQVTHLQTIFASHLLSYTTPFQTTYR